jgi:hypothetical protein
MLDVAIKPIIAERRYVECGFAECHGARAECALFTKSHAGTKRSSLFVRIISDEENIF